MSVFGITADLKGNAASISRHQSMIDGIAGSRSETSVIQLRLPSESLAQSFHFKTAAKQREQASDQMQSAPDRQQDVDVPVQFRKVPENDDGEQRAAKDKTEASQKQENVIEDHVGTSKRDWNVSQAVPKRELHDEQDTDRREIRELVVWKLFARIDGDLPELG